MGCEVFLLDLSFAVHDDRGRDGNDLQIRICRRHHGVGRFGARLRVDGGNGIGICLGLWRRFNSRLCTLETATKRCRSPFD